MAPHKPRPMTYSGSALRVMRVRRRLKESWKRAGITPFVILLLVFWWLAVTVWYPIWFLSRLSIWAVRRDVRKRRAHSGEASRTPHA
jgi:hypothetical protein